MVHQQMVNNTSIMISAVIPVYGCNACLEELCTRIIKAIQPICSDYEIILVDDASPDGAWMILCIF